MDRAGFLAGSYQFEPDDEAFVVTRVGVAQSRRIVLGNASASMITSTALSVRGNRSSLLLHAGDEAVAEFQWTTGKVLRFRLLERGTFGDVMFAVERTGGAAREIRMGDFDPLWHTYYPLDHVLENGASSPGPVVIEAGGDTDLLIAHEAGTEAGDSPVQFAIKARSIDVGLASLVSPYADRSKTWRSPWLHFALGRHVDLLHRDFLDQFAEHKRPQIRYNSWYLQESNHYFSGEPFLAGMSEATMLAEMEAAAIAGVGLFVLDVGWYRSTGDYEWDEERLPGGVERWVREAETRGLELGLWMNPSVAAISSQTLERHLDQRMVRGGEPLPAREIWESELSAPMCLASSYIDVIRSQISRFALAGIKNLKFDGLWPTDYEWAGTWANNSCDSSTHFHGDDADTPEDRARSYANQFSLTLSDLCEYSAELGVSIDIDITEDQRRPNLGTLMYGRYFLINNGPYYSDLGIPESTRIEPNTFNAVFYPGATHSRVIRHSADFNSRFGRLASFGHVLLSDNPKVLANALATSALAGLAVWGRLAELDPATLVAVREYFDRVRLSGALRGTLYSPRRIGASPEIWIAESQDRKARVLFAFSHQSCRVTERIPRGDGDRFQVEGSDGWRLDGDQLVIELDLERDDARTVFLTKLD